MQRLYSIGIFLYGLSIKIASVFNHKAALWVKGRFRIFEQLSTALQKPSLDRHNRKLAWFHCASLGEFEQGRPVMEAFRKKHPEYIILLTFFSPSGYEVRKAYTGADIVFYLPLDTRKNAARFIGLVKPDVAFFVKYEFWFNFLELLHEKKIKTFLISAIFRGDQHFFKWYGDWSRSILRGFTHIFVQNNYSHELLSFVGVENVTVSGDTRLDRVADIAADIKEFPLVKAFAGNSKVLIAGSTWPADEELLVKYLQTNKHQIKTIIAPHEIEEAKIRVLIEKLGSKAGRYSQANPQNISTWDVLIIDSIGMLAHLYNYGTIAYIGGGFGEGIHNILEAAVFGLPVIFGPNYTKFHEALELLEREGAFPVDNYSDFEQALNNLLEDPELLTFASDTCKLFIDSRTGATRIIMKEVQESLDTL